MGRCDAGSCHHDQQTKTVRYRLGERPSGDVKYRSLRLTMLRYGIDDLRLFYENDLAFLRQFA